MLAATLVARGQAQTLPLPPAFVRPQDGALKRDCERRAAKRWLQRHGARRAPLRPVYLGDDLYACQPVCRAMLDSGGDFLLTCKPDSHKTLYEYLDGVDLPTRHGTSGRGAQRRIHRYRWMTDLPVRDGDDALRANWFEIASRDPTAPSPTAAPSSPASTWAPTTSPNSPACARTRWKIENETFNVLKQHGYHLEHNFGHGKDTLASVLVVLNLLAFAMRAACELTETLWQRARRRLGPASPPVRAHAHHHLLSGLPVVDRPLVPARYRRTPSPASLNYNRTGRATRRRDSQPPNQPACFEQLNQNPGVDSRSHSK